MKENSKGIVRTELGVIDIPGRSEIYVPLV
jgi:hypothetical protein